MNRFTKALGTAGVVVLFAAGSLIVAGPASADEPPYDQNDSDVTATVNAGIRSATLGELTFDAATVSHNDQSVSSSATLAVNDISGTGAGWQVTVQASALTFTAGADSDQANDDLAASNLTVIGQTVVAEADTVSSLTDVTGTGATALAIGTPQIVATALRSTGEGSYTSSLTFNLTIPANTRNGSYSGIITTTMAVAPQLG